MTLAASFLGGAKSRLLPPSVPFRFFVAATVFHVAFWAMLIVAAEEIANFVGGSGPTLAAIHLLTLGVLAMTAIGAALQLLPVATKQPLRAVWPARIASWLLIPGVPILATGMAFGNHGLQALGGAASVVALAMFGGLIADNLRRARTLALVVSHGWAAMAALAAILVLGFSLIADGDHGFLPDRESVATVHMILAIYGFMGLLAFGFSAILVPMFALSPAPGTRAGTAVLALALGGVGLACAGALLGQEIWVAIGAGIGVIAALGHVMAMGRALRKRMRRRLGLSFALVGIAWVFLPLSLALGAAAALGPIPRGPALFGAVALGGWLLSFVLGILQRIVPFLASMHAAKPGRAPPLVSTLTPEAPLKAHFACHVAALALLLGGIALDSTPVLRLGAVVGFAGSLAFGTFVAGVLSRLARHRVSNAP